MDSFQGETLNGAFTIWIRRPLRVTNAGEYSDDTRNDALVVVAEGVAPYTGPGDAFTRARQAVRVLETRFALALGTEGEPCGLGKMQGQEGGSPMGENFNPCANVTPGAGALTSTAVERDPRIANRSFRWHWRRDRHEATGLALGRRLCKPLPPRGSRSACRRLKGGACAYGQDPLEASSWSAQRHRR
jgi:hypothetical protein